MNAHGKGCWYFVYTRSCVLCSWSKTERERRWDPRPASAADRHEYVEFACGVHFA